MIYRIYPCVLFLCCMAWWLGLVSGVAALTKSAWWQLLPPLPALWLGLMTTTFIATRFPRMKYVNDAEINGLGYVHAPVGPMLLVLLIQVLAVLVFFAKSTT